MRAHQALALLGIALATSLPATITIADSPLIGRVLDPDGKPVAKARVFIYTASVRTGTSPYCPSCYPDCRKAADTDRDGRFSIRALSDSLRFRVLVMAKDWDPLFVDRVDPMEGPVEFRLAKRRVEKTDPQHSLRGQVLDPMSQPVVGATLEPFGYAEDMANGAHRARFGLVNADPLCVTDDQGRFSLALGDSGVLWFIRVRARDLAPQLLSRQPASATPITVRMRHGATVTGRLVRDGKPLAGVGVGLVQAVRAAQFMAYGHDEIATDERGVFTFPNVTPGEDYFVHGKMASLGALGVLDTGRVRVQGDESLIKVGDLPVTPGRRVSGQVVLSNGGPVPPGTRILLSLENGAWDSRIETLDQNGRFDMRGIPPCDATLYVRLKGYRFAPETSGYREAYGSRECAVPATADVDGLRLVLEPDGS